MKHIRMTVAYDGTDFHGFQRQASGIVTVQQTLEDALSLICKEPITLTGAGRTDAGVHARGQVVGFSHRSTIPTDRFRFALAPLLPPSVSLCRIEETSADFHARKSAVAKTYSYTFFNGPIRDPFCQRYTCFEPEPMDVEAMRSGIPILTGTHDFFAFRASGSVQTDPVRTIYALTVRWESPCIRIYVTGDGFLYHMVRNIAGALSDLALGRLSPSRLQEIRDGKDRRKLGKTAPPQGLCMENVYYTHSELTEGLRLFHT